MVGNSVYKYSIKDSLDLTDLGFDFHAPYVDDALVEKFFLCGVYPPALDGPYQVQAQRI